MTWFLCGVGETSRGNDNNNKDNNKDNNDDNNNNNDNNDNTKDCWEEEYIPIHRDETAMDGAPDGLGLVGISRIGNRQLIGEGDVDWVAFDDAVAGGWGLRDDGADG
ncbi:hypothetical protein [Tunturiibacter gelidiferens]|uniref:Uncharacterized protein n=1 Tax=Tunturiibacter gelidiferens TaxID=3069689 RepID=A0AAU7Z6D6_9BACT